MAMRYNLVTYLVVPGDEIEDVIKEISNEAADAIRSDADGIDNLEDHIKDAVENAIDNYCNKR